MSISRMRRVLGFRIAFIVSVALISWLCGACLYDLLAPSLYGDWCPRGRVVVIDVDGIVKGVKVPVVRSLSVMQFLSLGRCNARYLIIVSHGLRVYSSITLPPSSFALETSEEASIASLLLYPLYIVSEGILKGHSFGSTTLRLAVTERIAPFMDSLRGKVVILVTCPMGNVASFAKALVSRGCSMVAYPTYDVFEDNATKLVSRIIECVKEFKSLDSVALCLKTLGFAIVKEGAIHASS